MSTEWAKGCWRGLNPDEQIEAALRDGLSEDRSGIDSNPVHGELALSSKPLPTPLNGGAWPARSLPILPDSDKLTNSTGPVTDANCGVH